MVQYSHQVTPLSEFHSDVQDDETEFNLKSIEAFVWVKLRSFSLNFRITDSRI